MLDLRENASPQTNSTPAELPVDSTLPAGFEGEGGGELGNHRARSECGSSIRRASRATIRELVEAFVGAIMERAGQGDAGWSNYTRLIAAIAISAEWSYLTDKHFNQVARQYIAEMKRSLPKVTDERLHQAFFFLLGAMCTVCARPDRVETLSQGRFGSKEVAHMTESLYTFLAGGITAVADDAGANKAARPERS